VCDAYDATDHSYCKTVGAALAVNVICTILRIVAIVLGSMVSCCRPARFSTPSVAIVATYPAGVQAQGIPMATYPAGPQAQGIPRAAPANV